MRVSELITLLQSMPQHDLVCLQTTHQPFSAVQTVVSDCGVVYIRDHTLQRVSERIDLNGSQYEVTRTSRMTECGVVSWTVHKTERI